MKPGTSMWEAATPFERLAHAVKQIAEMRDVRGGGYCWCPSDWAARVHAGEKDHLGSCAMIRAALGYENWPRWLTECPTAPGWYWVAGEKATRFHVQVYEYEPGKPQVSTAGGAGCDVVDAPKTWRFWSEPIAQPPWEEA